MDGREPASPIAKGLRIGRTILASVRILARGIPRPAPYRAAVIRRIALIQSGLRGSPSDSNGEDRGTRTMRPAIRTAIHWVEVAGICFVLAGIAAVGRPSQAADPAGVKRVKEDPAIARGRELFVREWV